MQLNKVYIILFFFTLCKVYGQPGPKRFYFYGNVFLSDNNKRVSFLTRDSVDFISVNSKIKLSTYIIEKGVIKNSIPFKFERKIDNCYQIRSIKIEYWDGKIIGEFKFLFKIKKGKKTMLVYFDFTKNLNDSKIDTKLENFTINFKEGTYEVTDSNDPKLIRIKDD